MKLITKLKKFIQAHANMKNIVVLFILSQAIYICMTLFTFPIIELNSSGIKAFDLSPMGYSYENASSFLDTLSQNSRSIYLFVQEPLDLLYPFISSMFIMLTITHFSKKNSNLMLFALLPLVFDYLENAFVTTMLVTNNPTLLWVQISSSFTIMKSLSTTVCYCIIIALIIKRVNTFIKERKYA